MENITLPETAEDVTVTERFCLSMIDIEHDWHGSGGVVNQVLMVKHRFEVILFWESFKEPDAPYAMVPIFCAIYVGIIIAF